MGRSIVGHTALGKGHHILGRRLLERITIANPDAGVRACMDAAIAEAWRAARELPRLT
ncbi:MAG: hypothetical protein P0120_19750 [Nitrospira sp.]|nr:hypothetical protein [Nitrospira sp.]